MVQDLKFDFDVSENNEQEIFNKIKDSLKKFNGMHLQVLFHPISNVNNLSGDNSDLNSIKKLFSETQGLPQIEALSDEEIEKEVLAYRHNK